MENYGNDENFRESAKFSSDFNALRPIIISCWKDLTTSKISSSRSLSEVRLLANMSKILDELTENFTGSIPLATVIPLENISFKNGGDRANETTYDASDIAQEFHLLKNAIFFIAAKNLFLIDSSKTRIIIELIDVNLRDSLKGFELARQKRLSLVLATMMHDIRTPLSVANGNAQLIRIQAKSPTVEVLANKITSRLSQINNMIEGLLDSILAHNKKQEQIPLSKINVREMIFEVIDEMELGERTELICESDFFGIWCLSLIKRALQNLLSNAAKFSTPGSKVSIMAVRSGERAIFTVHNEGDVIPEAKHANLFEVFDRLDEISSIGWGLGLPLVQTVATLHGGSVSVLSDAHHGTSFLIDIPVDSSVTRSLNPGKN